MHDFKESVMKHKIKSFIGKNRLTLTEAVILLLLAAVISFTVIPAGTYGTGDIAIVVDAGHGGIDGGANREGLLEKDLNLDISKKLELLLIQKGYRVVMTRQTDISLDHLDSSDSSRHKRDLKARVNIINTSKAQLFLSIHVNCVMTNPRADGSIVFYSDKFASSKDMATCIQRTLNKMIVNYSPRTVHDPKVADFFILRNSTIPGVLVETAFISNNDEKKLLADDGFRQKLSEAIACGAEQFLNLQAGDTAPGSTLPQ